MSRIIPTYEAGQWSTTEFSTEEAFQEFIFNLLKNQENISLMKQLYFLMNKLEYLMNKVFIVINLLDQKILLHIGKIKKINVGLV